YLFPLHKSDKFQSHGAGQRPSAKGGAVHAGMNASGKFFPDQQRAQRKSAGNGLGYGDKVRLNAVMLVGKPASGAAQAALDFIGNQHGIMLAGQPVGGLGKLRADWPDPAFALNKLKADGAHGFIEVALQILYVIELYELHSGHAGIERKSTRLNSSHLV